MAVVVATAGWSIPSPLAGGFPEAGSALERYATRLKGAEINSTFYRSHLPATYARWVASVPEDFRFAAKLPKAITHEKRLIGTDDLLARFIDEVACLGDRLGPLLVQLPPSLAFDPPSAEAFLAGLRCRFAGPVGCEPRHLSWFEPEADALLVRHTVARVAADPARTALAAHPGGFRGFTYRRLHGSPRMYYSAYDPADLDDLSRSLAEDAADQSWCVFDNTASSAALGNALDLQSRLGRERPT